VKLVRLYIDDVENDDTGRSAHIIGAESNVNIRATGVPSAVCKWTELTLEQAAGGERLVRPKVEVDGVSIEEIDSLPSPVKYFFTGSAIVSLVDENRRREPRDANGGGSDHDPLLGSRPSV